MKLLQKVEELGTGEVDTEDTTPTRTANGHRTEGRQDVLGTPVPRTEYVGRRE